MSKVQKRFGGEEAVWIPLGHSAWMVSDHLSAISQKQAKP